MTLPKQGGDQIEEILTLVYNCGRNSTKKLIGGEQPERWLNIPQAKEAIGDLMSKERKKGIRDGYNYAYTHVDLATSLSDALKRVRKGWMEAMERSDD